MQNYQPKSQFLIDVANNQVPLGDDEFGRHNFELLIALTRDEDRSNRDWATFLLALQERNTPEVRDALLRAAHDEDPYVSAEAICGLAHIDRQLALPLVRDALKAGSVAAVIFEAAEILADPSLAEPLRPFAEPSGDAYLDSLALDALKACETGQQS